MDTTTATQDLHFSKDFTLSPEDLFDLVTSPAGLLSWWGPEWATVPEHRLDFSRPGPWFSIFQRETGERFHVSGQVTHVRRPDSVGFTWAWHGEDGSRGHESHVTFTVSPRPGGATLAIDHRSLPDDARAARHREGWTSTLVRLEKAAGSAGRQ